MLSIEKLPSDPCLLKSSSIDDDDERPSSSSSTSSDKKHLDLSNNFSIRDYVFRTRRKDIKTNWPFSQKNLQLCLKHGLTDVLPPFHQTVKGKDNIVTSQEEHVKVDDSSSTARCIIPKLAVDYRNIDISSGSDREKIFQSTTTSQSCSEIDSNKSCKVPSAPMSNKSGSRSTIQPPAKKCKLVVKLGNNITDRTLGEDTTTTTTSTNSFVVSEAMASKVCPVCKTFSSSSNTTLNAHIDQCLSGESSTIKWTANSKVMTNKHRIKPRKTRLMVDIYTTAVCCTLEDLDRRNGTNWASNPNLSARETELPVEKPPPPVSVEGNEGAVYIDANGTKLRILSKFNDERLPSSSKLVNDPLQKNSAGDKRSKFILMKKKKNHIQKHHKLLKSAPSTKKFCLRKPYDRPKINSGQEGTFSSKEKVVREDCRSKNLRSPDHMVSNALGTIKQWACSKRTGLARKISDKDNHQLSQGVMSTGTGVQNDNDVSPPTNSSTERCLLKSPRSSAKTVCLPESSQRMGDMLLEPQDEHSDEEPSLRKRADFSLSPSQFPSNKKRSLELPRCKTKHLKVDGHSVNDSFGRALSMKNIRVRTNTENSEINCELSTSELSPKASKLSLRKNLLSLSEGPAARGVKYDLKWNTASLERSSSMRCTSESEEAGVLQTEEETRCLRRNLSETKVPGSRVLNIRKMREGVMVSNVESTPGLKNSRYSAETDSDSEMGSPLAGASDAMKSTSENVGTRNDKTMDLYDSEFAVGGDFVSFSKSLDAGSDEFKGSFLSAKSGMCSENPISGVHEGGMFSAAEIGKSMIDDHNVHDDVTELGSNDGQGNYFLEVDPIPIPGPPGSFLPSPGRMSSEDDHHGSSSLTSSRNQSSVDHPHEFVDQDSSGSPTSAASTVSNFTMSRTGSRYSMENSVTLPQTANVGEEYHNGDGPDKLDVNTFFPGKGTFRFPNDKPCCCARKEGVASQGFSFNREESIAPSFLPANENQLMSRNSIRRPSSIMLKTNSFSLSDTSSGPETNGTKSSTGHTDFKLPTRDSESFSPSASSNPVLRLMGKDLMVVNKDEDSLLKNSSHATSVNDVSNTRLPGVSCSNFHQADANSRIVSHLPQSGDLVQHFDVRLLNGFNSHESFSRPVQQPSPSSLVSFSCKSSTGSGFIDPSFGNLCSGRNELNDTTCDMKKYIANPISHWQNATSTVKEIIVIDDSPDDSANDVSAYTMSPGKCSGGYTSRFVDFCESRPCGVGQNANLPSHQVKEIPGKWMSNPEGCGTFVHPSAFSASSSPAGPFRSSLYYSPGFS